MATCRAAGSLAASDSPLRVGSRAPPWPSLEPATPLGAPGPPQGFWKPMPQERWVSKSKRMAEDGERTKLDGAAGRAWRPGGGRDAETPG